MKALPNPLYFEWDLGNKDKNLIRHNVTNLEIEDAFINKPKIIFDDARHSDSETRYMLWGITETKRKLTIIFTIRGDKVRVISARDMNLRERRFYTNSFSG